MARLVDHRQGSARPALRQVLRDRLVWIRDELLAVNGPDAVRDMGRAYGLERIEQLEQDLPVSVYLYEVSDAVPGDQMRGLPIHERYTLDTVGRLTNVLAIPGRFVARSDASET